MKVKLFSILFAALFLVAVCAEKSFAASPVNWSKQVITVKGIGFAPAGFSGLHARQLAKRAAIADAYRQLAEAVNGVKVTGETTVSAMTLVSDIIRTQVETTVNGMQPISERAVEDGYEVTLQMPLFGKSNSLAGIVLERPTEKIAFPEPVMNVAPSVPAYTSTTPIAQRIEIVVNGAVNTDIQINQSANYSAYVPLSNIPIASLPQINNPTPIMPQIKMPEVKMPTVPQVQQPITPQVKSPKIDTTKKVDKVSTAKVSGDYTGLIVDCRNLDLQPVMSPTIQTDSDETIYGNKNLDYDKIIEFGAVGYSTDINETVVTERAGKNPLVVKATALKKFNSTPVITTADSNRILIENKSSKFLDKMNVVFMM